MQPGKQVPLLVTAQETVTLICGTLVEKQKNPHKFILKLRVRQMIKFSMKVKRN
jgi:hypothetical protein